MIENLHNHSDIIMNFSALIAVVFSMLAVAWPYFERDDMSARIAKMEAERQRLRERERARLEEGKSTGGLITRPKPIYQKIVDRMRLGNKLEDPDIINKVQQAGFRGRAPVVTYLASRVIAPVALGILSFFYINLMFSEMLGPALVGVAAGAMAGLGYLLPDIYLKNKTTRRQQEITQVWPDALDLMLLSVEAGMSIEAAFRKVSEEIGVQSKELADELTLTTAELSYLQSRRTAYENLGRRVGADGVRSVMTSLIQAEKYGTPLAHALRVLAQENRDMRMAAAEKKAAALPPKLTVPMIVFFLPVLFVIIMTPAAIQILEELEGF